MSYIYKITNLINGKIYIGKTNRTIQERFREHCKDYLSREKEKRPLYAAMQKYGIHNFIVEQIEECTVDIVEEREKYWIEYYGSFKNGYNATRGGDGKAYINRDLVIKNYEQLKQINLVAEIMSIDPSTVHNILLENNIPIRSGPEVLKDVYGISVGMYDKNNNFLRSFNSYTEAAQWMIVHQLTGSKEHTARTHISEVCNGKRKSAMGFIWKKI